MKKLSGIILLFILLVFCRTAQADTIANSISCTMGNDPLVAADAEGATFNCATVLNSNQTLSGCGDTATTYCRLSIMSAACNSYTSCAKRERITAKVVSGTTTYTFTVKARQLEDSQTSDNYTWATGDKVAMLYTAIAQSIAKSDEDWTAHNNYASACTGVNFAQGIGDTLSCAQPSNITGTAAYATALAANQGTTTTVLHGNAAGTPAFSAIADADVPNDITITLAGSATVLAANGANCSAGQAPLGVDASGAVEGCWEIVEQTSPFDNIATSPIYMASGSSTTTTGTIANGSYALTVVSASTFTIGHGIRINGAGAACAASTCLITSITNIVGTTVTLNNPASTATCAGGGCVVMHDDTVALQACIDASGTCFIPDGTYKITSTLTENESDDYDAIIGNSMKTIITTDQNITMLKLGTYAYVATNTWDFGTYGLYYYNVDNLYLNNTSSTKTTSYGIETRGLQRSNIRNIYCNGLKDCIVVLPVTHWTRFSDITGAGTGVENTIRIQGDGYNAPYNSTGCIYDKILGLSVKNATIYATGCTFGDLLMSNVNGTGITSGGNGSSGGAYAAIYLKSNGTCIGDSLHYASRITISNVLIDGVADSVLKLDGTDFVYASDLSKGGGVVTYLSHSNLESTSLNSIFSLQTAFFDPYDQTFNIEGIEAGSATLKLQADEGDDAADTWSIVSQASDNDLVITNSATEKLRIADTTGNLTVTGNILMADSKELYLGTGSDLELFHDGSNSYIQNNTGGIIIENDTSDGDISFKVNDGGVDTTVMTIDGATSYIGIGTTAPEVMVHASGLNPPSGYYDGYGTTASQAPTFGFRRSNSATVAHGATTTGQKLGGLTFRGNSGAAFTSGAKIDVLQNGTAGTYTPADLVFLTSSGAVDWTDRMRLTSTGTVTYSPIDAAATPIAPTASLKFFGFNKSLAADGTGGTVDVFDSGIDGITLPTVTTSGYLVVTSSGGLTFQANVDSAGVITMVWDSGDGIETQAFASCSSLCIYDAGGNANIWNDSAGTLIVNVMFWYN